jgi:hypothetical protein
MSRGGEILESTLPPSVHKGARHMMTSHIRQTKGTIASIAGDKLQAVNGEERRDG